MTGRRTLVALLAVASAVALMVTTPTAATAAVGSITGYYRENSGKHTLGSGQLSVSRISCPNIRGGKIIGGGVLVTSGDVAVLASYPSGTEGWWVEVDNAGPAAAGFYVYAVCAAKVVGLQIATYAETTVAPGSHGMATVACATGFVPLGGGGSGPGRDVDLRSSGPTATGWQVEFNNGTASTVTERAYVVCGKKPTRYSQRTSVAKTVAPGAQASRDVTCPDGTSVLSGGGITSAPDLPVNLGSSHAPLQTSQWTVSQSNHAAHASTLSAVAVCSVTS